MSAIYCEKLVEELASDDFDTLVEFACGDFQNGKMLLENNKIKKLYGCDIESDKWGCDYCDIQYGTPYENKSFDVVLIAATLLLFNDETVKTILKEAERVARKIIVLVEPYKEENTPFLESNTQSNRVFRNYLEYFNNKKVAVSKFNGWPSQDNIYAITKVYL